MKKLVILALITSLAAGAVFAQDVAVSGFFRVGADAINGNNIEDSDPGAAVTGFRARLNFSAANDEETFGGFIRLQADALRYGPFTTGGYAAMTGGAPDWDATTELVDLRLAWVWWQPIELLKLQAGILDDFYVNENIEEFGGNAEQTKVHYPGFFDDMLVDTFAQQEDRAGAALSLYLIEPLTINVGIPYGVGTLGGNAGDVYKQILAQAQINLADIGRISVAFKGGEGFDTPAAVGRASGSGNNLYAAFYLTAIETLRLNFGLRFTLPYSEEFEAAGVTTTYNYSAPFLIGLGATCTLTDTIGLGVRLGVGLGENAKWKAGTVENEWKGTTDLAFELLPSIDVGVCKIFINLGLDMILPDEGDAQVGFYANPYVEKTVGGGSFFGGLKIISNPGVKKPNTDDALIKWSVPVGMKFAF